MQYVLFKSGDRQCVPGRCLHGWLDGPPPLSFPIYTYDSKNIIKSRQTRADAILIAPWWTWQPWFTTQNDGNRIHQTAADTTSPHPECGNDLPLRFGFSAPDGMENSSLIEEVLDKARKPKLLYNYKWRNFLKFAETHHLQSSPVSLTTLLWYLRYLLWLVPLYLEGVHFSYCFFSASWLWFVKTLLSPNP